MSSATPVPALPSSLVRAGEPAIRVRNLNHWFTEGEARKQVLFDNNLEVAAGEIVIMTGPSGSGKTTMLTLLGGLRTVQEGEVRVLGHSLAGLAGKELVRVRRDIGFIFQAHNLFASLTAFQNVKMALELKETEPARIREKAVAALTSVGLAHRIYYKPGRLSGGQKQRVAIARALANRPKLILADEPTAALDEASGRDVVNLLKRLSQEEQCTSLIVTHDNRILDVADRIVSMVEGRIKSNVLVQETIEICAFLKENPLFSGLTTGALSNIAEKMGKERQPAGAVIIRQGDPGDKFYLIKEGTVDVIVDQGRPTETRVATLTRGQPFGEAALMRDVPRNATVIACCDVGLYTLDKANFRAARDRSESFDKELRKILSQRQ
jgi:putative ABC transport system ATP-binding protein